MDIHLTFIKTDLRYICKIEFKAKVREIKLDVLNFLGIFQNLGEASGGNLRVLVKIDI